MQKGRKARHHTTPQAFLKAFTRKKDRGDFLWCFDKENPEQPAHVSAKDACVQKHFFSIKEPDGTWNTSTEGFLEQLENLFLPALLDLQNGKPIQQELKIIIADALTHLHLRTPTSIENVRQMLQGIYTGMLETAQNDEKAVRRLYEDRNNIPELKTISDQTFEQFYSTVKQMDVNKLEIVIDKMYAFGKSYEFVYEPIREQLLTMHWGIIEASLGSRFLTADNPVNFFVKQDDGYLIGGGLALPGAGAICPLTPEKCLLICRDKQAFLTIMSGVSPCYEVNKIMLLGSNRFAYARENLKEFQMITKIAAQYYGKPTIDQKVVSERFKHNLGKKGFNSD